MSGPVQTATAVGTASPVTVVLGANTGSGNTLIVYVGEDSTASNTTVSSITLTGSSDTFVQDNTEGSLTAVEIWRDSNAASGHKNVVVNFNVGVASPEMLVRVEEWAGIATTTPLDAHPAGTSGFSAVFDSNGTGTLAQANELVVGCGVYESGSALTLTGPGSGWTNQGQVNQSTGGTRFTGLITGWIEPNSTASQDYSGTVSSAANNAACIVSYKLTGISVNLGTVHTTDNINPILPGPPVNVNIGTVATIDNINAITPAEPPQLVLSMVPVLCLDPLTGVVCFEGYTSFAVGNINNQINLGNNGSLSFNPAVGTAGAAGITGVSSGELVITSGLQSGGDSESELIIASAAAGNFVDVAAANLKVNGTNMTVP